MSTLVFCQIKNSTLDINSLKAIAAAQIYKQPITVLACCEQALDQFTIPAFNFIQDTYFIVGTQSPENIASCIIELTKKTSFKKIITANNNFNKQVLPQVATLLDYNMFTDVIDIIDQSTIKRPIFSGDFIATQKVDTENFVMSIRPSAFNLPSQKNAFESIKAGIINNNYESKVIYKTAKIIDEKLDLTTADIVISGGRGLGEAKHFELIYQLADKLNAAVGATRAAVDAGWVDNSLQVGQTGKVIAPKLYIAIGVSGAIQHLAGIKDSETIIAINTDPKAPIMAFADYAFEGDLFEILPELINALK